MDTIDSFTGEYADFSNFSTSIVYLGGHIAATVENGYQAAKAVHFIDRIAILNEPTPGRAKRAGRKVEIRPDWEQIKLWVMEDLLRQKFSFTENLHSSSRLLHLLGTGNATLIEGNYWNDRFWGVCNGEGENHLGRLLMQIRSDLRD